MKFDIEFHSIKLVINVAFYANSRGKSKIIVEIIVDRKSIDFQNEKQKTTVSKGMTIYVKKHEH